LHLTKHHGLGNDFLIVLDEANDRPVAPDAALARRLCNRHSGHGADGLIWGVGLGGRPPAGSLGSEAELGDVEFILWNSDGSEATISRRWSLASCTAVDRASSRSTLTSSSSRCAREEIAAELATSPAA